MPITRDSYPSEDRGIEQATANPGEKRTIEISSGLQAALASIDALTAEDRKELIRRLGA